MTNSENNRRPRRLYAHYEVAQRCNNYYLHNNLLRNTHLGSLKVLFVQVNITKETQYGVAEIDKIFIRTLELSINNLNHIGTQ